ncbi:MAG: prepilin-type N-terminal cleavage/methylation domain-containing protein [Candidatus Omnitrophica bacterium]|nr:prepilin-type N-terminal cleavage/methylation domain-containing protein [Candidatus Omnitrophota bacterium]
MNKYLLKRKGKLSLTGFTLLEVLIALMILGLGITSLYSIFPLGIRISRDVQMLGGISFFAQKKIEQLKITNETLSNSSGQEANFNWTIRVEDYSTENNIVLKKIQLDAEWLQGDNKRKKSFITYFK